MRRMIKKQSGLTAIGLMFILAVIAGVVLIVLRLFPLYNEQFQVITAFKSTVARPNAVSFTNKTAAKAFLKALSVTNVNRFTSRNIKDYLVVVKPKKKGEVKSLRLSYEARNTFVSDIYFVLVFDKTYPLTGPNVDG